MQPGTYLVDASRGERRFRIQRLLFEGSSYQIALAEDTHLDDKLVCVKTIAYDARRMDDKDYVAGRRKALHGELTFLARPLHLTPEPLDWIQLGTSETVLQREPVLVYEYMHGQTLYDYVSERFPQGMNPLRALRITREIASFLGEVHQQDYVFRDLDPRHVIVSFDDIIHFVGCGNATPRGERPNAMKEKLNSAYTAPEIRGEQSGQFLRPAADMYALGALFSFLLTGEEPRERVENPLSREAYEKLSSIEQPGMALLIARLMQPLAKNRIARAERLLPFCTPESLPSSTTKGFGMLQLPAPWSGAEPDDNRAVRSQLSPGPLISVEPKQEEGALEPAEEPRGCGAMIHRFKVLLGLSS